VGFELEQVKQYIRYQVEADRNGPILSDSQLGTPERDAYNP